MTLAGLLCSVAALLSEQTMLQLNYQAAHAATQQWLS
jgi:hypothetical protein